MTYTVYFRYFSEYEDEAENINEIVIHRYEADDLDELFEILEEDYENFDDDAAINEDAESDLLETRREYILIRDEDGNIIWPDMNFDSYEDGRILVGVNAGGEIYIATEDLDENEQKKIDDISNKILDRFIKYLENLFGTIMEDNIKVSYDNKIVDYKKGNTIKNIYDPETVSIYFVLTKKLPPELLNAKFLETEDFSFYALFPSFSENCYISQGYDYGEYDTGYFAGGLIQSYCNRFKFDAPKYLEVKKLLHIDDGIEV